MSMPRLSEIFLIREDKRGNIQRLLKLPGWLADEFHKRDEKLSFALARCFALWVTTQHGYDEGLFKKDLIDSEVPKKPKDKLKTASPEISTQTPFDQSGTDEPMNIGDQMSGESDPRNRMRKARGRLEKLVLSYYIEFGDGLYAFLKQRPNVESQINGAKTLDDVSKIFDKYEQRDRGTGGLLTFPDGSSWQWLSDEHLKTVGQKLSHCYATGGRAMDHRGALITLYLKDPQLGVDSAAVTMTWNKTKNSIYQIKGEHDRLPPPGSPIWNYIEEFCKKYGPRIRDTELNHNEQLKAEYERLTSLSKVNESAAVLWAELMKGIPESLNHWFWPVSMFESNDRTLKEKLLNWFKEQGFTQKIASGKHSNLGEVLVDPSKWKDMLDKHPSYERYSDSVAGAIAAEITYRHGYGNAKIAANPLSFLHNNRGDFQDFIVVIDKLTDNEYSSFEGVKSFIAKPRNVASAENYEHWWPHEVEGDHMKPAEFARAHPEVMQGLHTLYTGHAESMLRAHTSDVEKQPWIGLISDPKEYARQKIERENYQEFVVTPDGKFMAKVLGGRWILLLPEVDDTGGKVYYPMKLGRKD